MLTISFDRYMNSSFRPDCDFVDGVVSGRHVGLMKHSYAQTEIAMWLGSRQCELNVETYLSIRLQVRPACVRVADVAVMMEPVPDEQVFTVPPYLCVEIAAPEDTMSEMQDRIDDYLSFGVPNIWVIDPWKHRGWMVTAAGWATASDGIMRTSDSRAGMPLADVLLP